MRKVGSDEYREHADYRRADAIKQLKSDKNQWICGPGKQQCTDRQSPKPDEEQRPATPASRLPSNPRTKRATTICGRMINAAMMSEERLSPSYTRAAPTTGSMAALASWNRNRPAVKVSTPGLFQRLRCVVLAR